MRGGLKARERVIVGASESEAAPSIQHRAKHWAPPPRCRSLPAAPAPFPGKAKGRSTFAARPFEQLSGEAPGGPNYFFGLHFSQTFPAFVASTQHLCEHSLPAAFAFSQQVSAKAGVARIANANAAAVMSLVMFIGRTAWDASRALTSLDFHPLG